MIRLQAEEVRRSDHFEGGWSYSNVMQWMEIMQDQCAVDHYTSLIDLDY
jgi:hypothetical protein